MTRTRIALAGLLVLAVGGLVLAVRSRDSGVDIEGILNCTRPRVHDLPAIEDGDPVAVTLTPIAPIQQAITLDSWPDGRLVVGARTGEVYVVDAETGDDEQIFDVSDRTVLGAEGGLLGLAVAPDDNYLYVSYTDTEGFGRIIELEIAEDAGGVVPTTEREVIGVEHPAFVHNGGMIAFGPDDFLYVGFGFGGETADEAPRAADLGRLDGKMIRIDPRPDGEDPYGIPDDNPFVGEDGVRPEIWASGLRNPWRFSFDGTTGDLWVADVGSNCYEEVHRIADGGRAADLGFPRYEEYYAYFNDSVPDDEEADWPVFGYAHTATGCAIVGGYVATPDAGADLAGRYLFADYCDAGVQWLRVTDDGVVERGRLEGGDPIEGIQSFGQDRDGRIYVLSIAAGVTRIDPADD